jgi:hypothetical protein
MHGAIVDDGASTQDPAVRPALFSRETLLIAGC